MGQQRIASWDVKAAGALVEVELWEEGILWVPLYEVSFGAKNMQVPQMTQTTMSV